MQKAQCLHVSKEAIAGGVRAKCNCGWTSVISTCEFDKNNQLRELSRSEIVFRATKRHKIERRCY